MDEKLYGTIQKIVVPIDFSEPSRRAARYAASLARRLGASVHLVHVVEEPTAISGALEFYAGELARAREDMYGQSRSQLQELVTHLGTDAVRCTTEVRFGSTADRIAQAVVDYGADLVVMATHGRAGLPHMLLGSVAEQLIRTARCPVLAIRDCGQVHAHLPKGDAARVA
jgi:nucleotide-binding universal stress UspA family protein